MTKRKYAKPQGYGITNPLQNLSPLSIKSTRDPVAGDIGPEVGTIWINTSSNSVWILTSVAAGAATWTTIS